MLTYLAGLVAAFVAGVFLGPIIRTKVTAWFKKADSGNPPAAEG